MNIHPKPFLGLEAPYTMFEDSAVAVLPFPYEGGISYGAGTALAPESILEASAFLELYDEVLDAEPYRMGITTILPQPIPLEPEKMIRLLESQVGELLDQGKFVVVIGGDHSITAGSVRAFHRKFEPLSVVQLDAHADLRETYDGSRFSHACVMSRVREMTRNTLQVGIRSLSSEEAGRVKREGLPLCTMGALRRKTFHLDPALEALPDPVFITVDVDVFDWSVVASTGTPEPGGLLWDEGTAILEKIFEKKQVVGFDVVELACRETDRNSPFAAAKLIYKMLGYRLASEISRKKKTWPERPAGPLFSVS